MKKKLLAGLAVGLFWIAGVPSAQGTIIQNTFGLSDPQRNQEGGDTNE